MTIEEVEKLIIAHDKYSSLNLVSRHKLVDKNYINGLINCSKLRIRAKAMIAIDKKLSDKEREIYIDVMDTIRRKFNKQ